MNDARDLLAVVESVVTSLRRHGVPYYITGSFASSYQGEFRATNDLDIVAELNEAQLPALFADLSREFVADIEQAREALRAGTSFNLIHTGVFLKVDFFPCATPFNREAMRRAESVPLDGVSEPLRISTAEDIILAKLRWYQLTGGTSSVQERDVRGLMVLNAGKLDEAYLAMWASTLGVSDLLARFKGDEP